MNSNHDCNDPLDVISSEGYWMLNKMSPMHNLHYDTVILNQYALKICETIVNNVATSSTLNFEVVINEISTLKYSKEDSSALMITVTSNSQGSTGINKKRMYRAILMSWGVTNTLDDAIHLPYMLETGETHKFGTLVKPTLKTLFNCNIEQCYFTEYQLLQVAFNIAEDRDLKNTDVIILYFKDCNSGIEVPLSSDLEDLCIIWNEIIINIDIENGYDPIIFASDLIKSKLLYLTTITSLELIKLYLPEGEIRNNGTVKIKTPKLVNSVFTVLNEITTNLN